MKIKNIYKELLKEENYKKAYEQIKSNPGNMTKGVDNETLNKINVNWIKDTINKMKDCSFKFKPSKRIYIEKKNGKLRPLGIPSPRDKIVQKVILNTLEKEFEKIFLNCSYGFRPGRSCHDALRYIRSWKRTTWMIEGDIKGYFDNIDHHKLHDTLKKYIDDTNFSNLYWKLVKAGYIEKNKETNRSELKIGEIGVPQGGILSPLLSNIYLHELDTFMQNIKKEYNSELKTIYTKEYKKILNTRRTVKRRYGKNKTSENLRIVKSTEKLFNRTIPSFTQGTKINYARYADDFIVGVIGTRKQAEEIRNKINEFLKNELLLELNLDKTKITNINKEFAPFLGYDIGGTDRKFYSSLRVKSKNKKTTARVGYGNLYVYIPIKKLIDSLINKGFVNKTNKYGKYYGPWINLDVEQILLRYLSVLRGICNYYILARNDHKLKTIEYLLRYSCAHTLAAKFKTSIAKIFKKYGKYLTMKIGNKNMSLKYEPSNKLTNKSYKFEDPFRTLNYSISTKFLMDATCKICGTLENIEIHHVRHLKDLNPKLSAKDALMAKMKRKQIPLCITCHNLIHSGKYSGPSLR